MNPKSESSRRQLWLAGTLATLVLALGAAALVWLSPPRAQASPVALEAPAVPVSVAPVLRREVALWDEFAGRLEAVERVDLRARVPAAVQALHFREGQLVARGDLLVTLDAAPYEAELQRAQAQLAAAQARLAHARSERQRAERLWQERAIAQREFDERAHAEADARAQQQGMEAALQSARLDLSYTRVRAPVAGRVGRPEVTVGNLVAAGPDAPVLTTLVSVSPIYASFEADERTAARALNSLREPPAAAAGAARPARAVPLDVAFARIPVQMGTSAEGGTPHQGRLQGIDNRVDARSGTVRLRAVFDNPQGLLMPGQYARLRLGALQPSAVLLINERAIGTDQDRKFVWVVGPDQAVNWRAVTLGASVDGLRVVTSGLTGDERIVVNGLQRVRPGVKVEPRPVAMDERPQPQAREGGPAPVPAS